MIWPDLLRFSGHSFEEYAQDFCLSRANVPVYPGDRPEASRGVPGPDGDLCGAGAGLTLEKSREGLDYVIGSVHGLRLGEGQCVYVDASAQNSQRAVDEYFGGDWYRYTDAYYDLVADLLERPSASGSATLTWSLSSTSRSTPSMRTATGISVGLWK